MSLSLRISMQQICPLLGRMFEKVHLLIIVMLCIHSMKLGSIAFRVFRCPALRHNRGLTSPRGVGTAINTLQAEQGKETRPKRKRLTKLSDMDENAAKQELESLNNELSKNDKLYFEDNAPEISDAEYDRLVRRAEAIVGKFSHLTKLIPQLHMVGMGKSSKFEEFRHSAPMLSLGKAFHESELLSFLERVEKTLSIKQEHAHYVMEPKIDGLSLALVYEQSQSGYRLVRAGTRGDGTVGEDVTANAVKHIQTIPQELPCDLVHRLVGAEIGLPGMIEVRGEVFMTKADFAHLNNEHQQNNTGIVLSTARNAAAGALRKVKGEGASGLPPGVPRCLQFFAYSAHGVRQAPPAAATMQKIDLETTQLWATQSATLNNLKECGFQVAEPWTTCATKESVVETCRRWSQARLEWAFAADGVVVKVDDAAQQEALGATSRCPRWAVAYKFADDVVETVLRGIEVTVGRTGVLTPVGVLQAVQINGVTVERATLHNENEVNRLRLRVGDRVLVKRAGDVIPKIVDRVEDEDAAADGDGSGHSHPFRLPSACPECGSPTERAAAGAVALDTGNPSQDLYAHGAFTVRCTGGVACPAQVLEQISHFCSRDAANIDGLGQARIDDLIEGKIISDVLDLYRLRARDLAGDAAGLRTRPGWGDRSVSHLLAAIDRARLLEDHRFLFGLGIRHVGQEMARLLIVEFGSFPALWEYLKAEAAKLRRCNTQYHLLPRRPAARKAAKQPLAVPSDGSADILYVQDCAARLLAVGGVGPQAVQALLSYAADQRTAGLVEGLMEHVSFTSGRGRDTRGSSSVAATLRASDRPQPDSGLPVNQNQELGQELGAESSKVATPLRPAAPLDLPAAPASLPLVGRVVVFTGKLQSGMARAEAEELCRSLGATTRSGINKSVNLVVHAGEEGARQSSKIRKATEYGIEVWSEDAWDEFLKLHGKSS